MFVGFKQLVLYYHRIQQNKLFCMRIHFEKEYFISLVFHRSDKFHDNENNSNAIFVEISPLISYAGEVKILISNKLFRYHFVFFLQNLEFTKGQMLKLPLKIEMK